MGCVRYALRFAAHVDSKRLKKVGPYVPLAYALNVALRRTVGEIQRAVCVSLTVALCIAHVQLELVDCYLGADPPEIPRTDTDSRSQRAVNKQAQGRFAFNPLIVRAP